MKLDAALVLFALNRGKSDQLLQVVKSACELELLRIERRKLSEKINTVQNLTVSDLLDLQEEMDNDVRAANGEPVGYRRPRPGDSISVHEPGDYPNY